MVAIAAEVEVPHVGVVILDVYDRVGLVGLLCTGRVDTRDVCYAWKGRIMLQIFVYVLGVLCKIVDLVVINNTNASLFFLNNLCVVAVLAIIVEVLVFIYGDVKQVVTDVAEPHFICLKIISLSVFKFWFVFI